MAPNVLQNDAIEAREGKDAERKSRLESDSCSSIQDITEAGKYGYGKCEPDVLQCGNNAKGFLVVYCFFVIVQGMLVNGFVNVSISTLEKRFGLKSSETGVVSTGYDIAFCVLTMFVTYFGARSHRPRMVAIGCFIMGIGAMVFMLPHFTTGPYTFNSDFSDTCVANHDGECENTTAHLHNYLYVFILGQLLHGVGCTPLYTLGLAFIEDSVPKRSASIYLGIANAASILGPVIGYGLGGVVLGFYVDFDIIDTSELEITPSDPRWVGAWWLGMMIAMACAFVICVPLFGFPREFPGAARHRLERQSEVPVNGGNEVAERENFGKSYKDFPIALLTLLKNPTYVFGSLASCSEAMVISGFTTFLPKIIENLFQQSAGFAAIVAGVISIPGGVVGHILAGVLVHKFNMKTANIYKFNILYCLLVCASAPVLYLACTNQPVAGITVSYSTGGMEGNLSVACNSNCSCQEEFFIPVCGADGINYFTACHAGCSNASSLEINETKYYYDCSCINGSTIEDGWAAKEGYCEQNCTSLGAFLGVFFIVVLFTFMSSTPALVATFRVVPPNMRSFALGVQWLLIRALGSIPGPIMFGSILDLACILWQTRLCDGTRGSCWIYDNDLMTLNVLLISVACKLVSAVLFFLAYWFYKPPVETENEKDLKNQTALVNEAFRDTSTDGRTQSDSEASIDKTPLEDDSTISVSYGNSSYDSDQITEL